MGMAALRPPPPPPPTRFEDLDADSILQILKRIPCKADRGRMFAVCRAWRTALSRILKPDEPPRELLVNLMKAEQIPDFVMGLVLKNKADAWKAFSNLMAPRALPWLLLPARFCGGNGDGCRSAACVLSGFRVHHYINIPPGARCFGSHDGRWLVLHFRAPHHTNQLLRAGDRHPDPRYLPAAASRVDAPRTTGHMYVHYLALSGRADDPDCFAAAVATCWWTGPGPRFVHLQTRRGVVAWHMSVRGDYSRLEILAEENGVDDTNINDVVWHKDEFHFLTRGGHVRACKPIMNGKRLALAGGWVVRRFVPVLFGEDLHIRDRYLVVSRGELLMVIRFTPHPLQRGTCGFKVFRETERKTPDACPDFPVDEYPWSCSELDTLDGRMLFVGHGCSRSYETDQYPGFDAAIYFLDDGDQYDNAAIFFRHGHATRYPCSDNGKWTQDGGVQRCFPRGDPSDRSAPVWLLP